LTDKFYRHGLPEVIISDNGSQFTSNEFSAFITSLGITHRLTAVYNPTTNGACKRMNNVIKEGLAVAYAESAQFLPALKRVVANYRSLPHAIMGETPAMLCLRDTIV
jgi:transposase InsO family protein